MATPSTGLPVAPTARSAPTVVVVVSIYQKHADSTRNGAEISENRGFHVRRRLLPQALAAPAKWIPVRLRASSSEPERHRTAAREGAVESFNRETHTNSAFPDFWDATKVHRLARKKRPAHISLTTSESWYSDLTSQAAELAGRNPEYAFERARKQKRIRIAER